MSQNKLADVLSQPGIKEAVSLDQDGSSGQDEQLDDTEGQLNVADTQSEKCEMNRH